MVYYEHQFSEPTAQGIENRVQSLRLASPRGANENINFRSTNTNTWWRRNPSAQQRLNEIASTLLGPVSQANKNKIFSTYMLVRNVRSIAKPIFNSENGTWKTYINRQNLHVNFETHPVYGEAFLQIIYYIDTPKYANGRNASPGNRGRLLVGTSQGNAKALVPARGRAVYFTPTDTWHEVVPQNESVNVNRKMIIMFLYKRTTRTNNVSAQFRNYHPKFPFGLRAAAGLRLPLRNENALANMLRRAAVINRKRKKSNNNAGPAKKKQRVLSPSSFRAPYTFHPGR
jgi:hypothetical protein